jgi:hypothetical protein
VTKERDTKDTAPPADEDKTAPEPIPEEGTFEAPTSNDVGEQTKTQADEEADEADEAS